MAIGSLQYFKLNFAGSLVKFILMFQFFLTYKTLIAAASL